MVRRGFLTSLIGLGLMISVGAKAQALFRTVVKVDSGDPEQMRRALSIVQEAGRYHVVHKESAEIRVVAVGEGLAMLRADISPVADRVIFISRSLPIVSWYVAAEDVAAATAASNAAPPLINGVVTMENGRVEAERLQVQGWSLITP